MALLQRLKSLLGLDTRREQSTQERSTDLTDDLGSASQEPAQGTPTDDSDTAPDHDEGGGEAVESVDVIDGIGPAYSERLAAANVATVEDLAAANAQTLADETDISPARLERWIDRAQQRT